MIAVDTGLVVIALVLSFLLPMATLGFGAFTVGLAPFVGLLTWPVSIIWGCLAASNHNEKLRAQAQQAQQAAQATYRPEIGRASCRERVEVSVVAGVVIKMTAQDTEWVVKLLMIDGE